MTGNTFLQIFLFLQIFIIGMLVTLAIQHALAHYRPGQPKAENPEPLYPLPHEHIPPAVKEKMIQESQRQFQATLNQSASDLQRDLKESSAQINNLVNKLASGIVASELERYQEELNRLQDKANTEMGGIRTEIAKHEDELKAKLSQVIEAERQRSIKEIESEKQRLIKQIDTKLADAVGSFLVETLQHNIDLGSQSSYLIAMLEEHKADFVKGVADETQPTG
jgi:F0F1-type ATP synthase membrane subunit b/b'